MSPTELLATATLQKLKEVPNGTCLKIDCGRINRSPLTVKQRITWVNRDNKNFSLPLNFSVEGSELKVWSGNISTAIEPEVLDVTAKTGSSLVTNKCNDRLLAAYRVLLEDQVLSTVEIIGLSPDELIEQFPKLMAYFEYAESEMGTVLT